VPPNARDAEPRIIALLCERQLIAVMADASKDAAMTSTRQRVARSR